MRHGAYRHDAAGGEKVRRANRQGAVVMGKLVILVLAAALVWSGYWFWGARTTERAITEQLDTMRAAGWQIDVQSQETRGFPNRFDTTFDEVKVTTPGGLTLVAPFFQLLALSYRPNQVIAALPPQIGLESVLGTAIITNDKARASMTVQPSPRLPLDHSSLVVDGLAVESAGRTLRIGQLRFATRLPEGAPDPSHQNIGLAVENVVLPDTLMEQLDAAGLGAIEALRLDATIELDAPLDRSALETPPAPQRIELHDLSLDWGDVTVEADGAVDVTAANQPEGELLLTVNDWRDALRVAVALGLVPEAQRSAVQQGLTLLSGLSGSGELSLPLVFDAGRMSLGPIPLGPAPVITFGG